MGIRIDYAFRSPGIQEVNKISGQGLSQIQNARQNTNPGNFKSLPQSSLSFGARLRETFGAARQIIGLVDNRVVADKQSQVGMLQGAKGLAKEVGGILDEINKAGVKNLQKELSPEFREGLGKLFGLDPKDELISKAAEYLFGEASKTTDVSKTTSKPGDTSELGNKILNTVGVASSIYNIFSNWGKIDPVSGMTQGAAAGAYIGSTIFPGVGTAIGGILGGIVGAASGLFGSHKHKDVIARDQLRAHLQQFGFINSQNQVLLADETLYDIGQDAGERLINLDGTERHPYDVDFSHPLAEQVVGWLNPLAEVLTAGNDKLRSDLTGYLTNAALSNAQDLKTARANVLAMYDASKLDAEQLVNGLGVLRQNNMISEGELGAYVNGLATLV